MRFFSYLLIWRRKMDQKKCDLNVARGLTVISYNEAILKKWDSSFNFF